jgi:hypothetical protein
MAPKWKQEAEKALQSGDHVERSYPGKLDGEKGYLIISDNRLLFVNEKGGLFSKKYNVIMNESLDDVEYEHKKRYGFEIKAHDSRHKYESEIPASIVEKALANAIQHH